MSPSNGQVAARAWTHGSGPRWSPSLYWRSPAGGPRTADPGRSGPRVARSPTLLRSATWLWTGQIALKHGLPYPKGRWEAAAKEIRDAALTQSWNPELQTFTEQLGGTGGLDAALLTLPVRNVIAFDDPRMVATTKAVAEGLDAGNGLLYRYLPEVSPDGLPGGEGAFLLCSF